MAPKTPNNQSKKVHTDLNSPSAGSAQKVIIGSDSASDSSDSPMPPALPRTEKNKKRGVNFKSGTTTLPAANSSNTSASTNSSNTGTPSHKMPLLSLHHWRYSIHLP